MVGQTKMEQLKMEQLLAQLKAAKEKGEISEKDIKSAMGIGRTPREIPAVGTLEAEATIKLFVVEEDNEGKYWNEQAINAGVISAEMASKILNVPTNELVKKLKEAEKLKEDAKKARDAKKVEKKTEPKKG